MNNSQTKAIVDPFTQSAFEAGHTVRAITTDGFSITVPILASNYKLTSITDVSPELDNPDLVIKQLLRDSSDGTHDTFYPFEQCIKINFPDNNVVTLICHPTPYCTHEFRLSSTSEDFPDQTPRILSFALGQSEVGGSTVPVDDLTGNDYVAQYIISDSSTTPDKHDPSWSSEAPTQVTL